MLRKSLVGLVAALALTAGTATTLAQTVGTAITYQGQLKNNADAVNGQADVRFTLFPGPTGGSPIGSPVTRTVTVTNGLFTTAVDFGAAQYATDAERWMQIEVRFPAGSGNFVPLTDRQRLTAAPYSNATRGIFVDANNNVGVGAPPLTGPFAGVFDVQPQQFGARFFVGDFAPGTGPIAGTQVVSWNVGSGSNGAQMRFSRAVAGSVVDIGQDANGNFAIEMNDARRVMVTPQGSLGVAIPAGGEPSALFDIGNKLLQGIMGNAGFSTYIRSSGVTSAQIGAFNFTPQLNGHWITLINQGGVANGGLSYNDATGQSQVQANIKNFVEPNPRDASTDIYYASLEGPEAGMYMRGTGQLINGQSIISLPAHFSDLASSQGMTVQLTPRSVDSKGLALITTSPTGFEVRELMRGTGTYAFDWEVKAVRKQYLDYRVVRSWQERRVANSGVSDDQAWKMRQEEVAHSNARAQQLEAAAVAGQQR